MNREIKFRMWAGNKMLYDVDNVMECLKQQMGFEQKEIGMVQYDHIGFHGSSFMQFTGLKDKNGKEIFESDIVNFRSHPHKRQIGEVYFHVEFARFAIKTQDVFEKSKNTYSINSMGNLNEIEVIGNIYETKL